MIFHMLHICNLCGPHVLYKCVSLNLLWWSQESHLCFLMPLWIILIWKDNFDCIGKDLVQILQVYAFSRIFLWAARICFSSFVLLLTILSQISQILLLWTNSTCLFNVRLDKQTSLQILQFGFPWGRAIVVAIQTLSLKIPI